MTKMYRITLLLEADEQDMTDAAYPEQLEEAVRTTVRDGAFNVEAWAPADDTASPTSKEPTSMDNDYLTVTLHAHGPFALVVRVAAQQPSYWYGISQYGTIVVTFTHEQWSAAIASYENRIGRSAPKYVRAVERVRPLGASLRSA